MQDLKIQSIKKLRVQQKWGDLLKEAHNYDAIVHGCNCFHTMGGGIAYGVAKMYPQASQEDKTTSYGDFNKLGTIQIVYATHDVTIVNAYTQYEPGRNVNYEAIAMCLVKVNHAFAGKTIALPMIGAGIAGGDFLKIRRMIKRYLKDCKVTIIYWPGDKEKIEQIGINTSVIV